MAGDGDQKAKQPLEVSDHRQVEMPKGCKTQWEWYLKPAEPPNRENMSGDRDLMAKQPLEVSDYRQVEMPNDWKTQLESYLKPAELPNRENISGDGDPEGIRANAKDFDSHLEKRPSAWNAQDEPRKLPKLISASHILWKADSYSTKLYQDHLKAAIKEYPQTKAFKDALKEEYYGVLKATEGFFMGNLEKFTNFLPGSVRKFSNNDVEAINCATFALEQLNQEKINQGEELKLVRLVRVNGLIKFDVMYWMTIEASDGKFYEAKVYDHFPYYGRELVFIRPSVHYPPRSDNAGLLPGSSTCSESNFAPLSPQDYGLPIPPDEAPKSVEDLINSPGVKLCGFDPYRAMKEAAWKKYKDVITQTECLYAGDIAKLSPYLPFGHIGSVCNQSPKANECARFVLDTWNKLKGEKLELKRLVKVNYSRSTFWLTIEASDGEFYEAKVVRNTPMHPRTEVEFIRRALHYPLRLYPRN